MSNTSNNQQNVQIISVIAAAAMALTGLLSISFRGIWIFFGLLGLAFNLVTAAAVITNNKKQLLLVGIGGKTFVALCYLLKYFSFANLLYLLSCLLLLAVVLMKTMPELDLEQYVKGEVQKYICYVPTAFLMITTLFFWFDGFVTFRSFLADVFELVAFAAIGIWVFADTSDYTFKMPADAPAAQGTAPVGGEAAAEDFGYYDMAMHVILLFVTCGIWQYIWIYKTTIYLNSCPDEEYRIPVNKLLLCMFVPFYYIYWLYRSAQRIDKMAAVKGVPSDIATLCLILAIFVPIAAPIIMQSKINTIVKGAAPAAPTASAAPAPAPAAPAAQPAATDAADQIRKFKELLDSGAITQEEYDAKKKELLGL